MARPTKKSAAKLRGKLKAAAKKRPPPKRICLEITKERIRLGLLLGRLENHALGELPKRQSMTGTQMAAAMYLVDKHIPKAQPVIELNGNVTVVFRDPTQRPANLSKERKGRATVPGDV